MPTKDDFNKYDANGDGILFYEEWVEIQQQAQEEEA